MTDVNLAYYPEAVYIIISIKDNGDYEMRGFRITDKEITETILKSE